MESEVAPRRPSISTLQMTVSTMREAITIAYLLTESNIKGYVQPVTLFALISVASSGVTTVDKATFFELATAVAHASCYIWLYMLHFDSSNQMDPESVKEDTLNKPWRAIPSGKLSIQACKKWYVAATCLLVTSSSLYFGGLPEAVAFMMETWVYDRVCGANYWWGKNIINALFYATGQLGATRVAARSMGSAEISRAGYQWCALLGLNTLTTIQIQDLRDQQGDRARGRHTMPLVMGDGPTRVITALFVTLWSVVCPAYWAQGHFTLGFVPSGLIGFLIVLRMLSRRTVEAGRLSWHLYTLLWLPSLYLTPLLNQFRLY
ncbi:hypothetical protein BB8028_0001g12370 [Beauveria bassiana]|uniref:Digeranylgeranylglyceryl phosphate synthase n=1 Tax=Beauveria bassiana TaxID=176275 RepID=A0A2S7XZ34_BEABA|nr:hypothetical protein BB8028_0001g12370 [Beauveria bassiana]